MTKAQLDMFSTGDTPDIREPEFYAPDADRIRQKLRSVLMQLEQAHSLPWDGKTLRFQKLVFPQMASALPGDEAEDLCQAFEAHLQRLT